MFRLILSILILSLGVSQIDFSKLDTEFRNALAEWNVPGYAVAIVKDGQIVFEKGYGVLENGKTAKVDQHTVFAIASNTKAFISASIASLIKQKKLNWNDPVRSYLPYFKLYSDYVSNKTNLRDVLSHRTGLGTFSGDVIWYKSDLSPKEIIMSASHLEQAYSFRNGYGYSNLMFITAGEVISSVTGKPWYQYVKSTFFEPLDMNRTVTSTNQLKSMRNVASPHKTINGKVVPIDWVNWDGMSAAGGIISSVHDMSLWLKLQLNHGIIDRDTIFTETAQNIMWTPHNNFTVSKSESEFYGRNFSGYGLGWGLNEYQNRKVVTHSGGYDGMFSRVTLVPSENLGIVILTNSMTSIGSWLVYDIMDAYFGKSMRNWNKFGLISQEKGDNAFNQRIDDQIAKRIKNTKPNYPTSDYIGEYYSDFYGTIKVEMQKGKLRLTFPRAKKLNATLEHWHYDTYQINWDEVHAWFSFGTVQFIADNQGKVNRIRFDIPNDDIFFEEIRAQKVK